MSIDIATLGMFRTCCARGGGGAPPIHTIAEEAEAPPCNVRIINVYFEDVEELPKIDIKILGGVTIT